MDTVSVEKYGMPAPAPGAAAEDNDTALFEVTNGLERNVRFGDLSHGDGGLHSGGLAFLFQEILQCQAIHHGAKHAHVVAAGAVDASLLQFRPTEEVTAADHDRYLHALLDSGNDFTCDASDHGRIDADLAATECLAGELE